MKNFKFAELLINSVLIFVFISVFAITQSFEMLFISYFLVGGIQLLSILVHVFKGWFSNHFQRLGYYVLLFVLIPFCFMGVGIWFLLYAAPLMATFYVWICYKEWQILKLKELVHLK